MSAERFAFGFRHFRRIGGCDRGMHATNFGNADLMCGIGYCETCGMKICLL